MLRTTFPTNKPTKRSRCHERGLSKVDCTACSQTSDDVESLEDDDIDDEDEEEDDGCGAPSICTLFVGGC